MNPTNQKIIVSVNQSQKDAVLIGDFVFKMVPKYEKNYRYRSPTVAIVIAGNKYVQNGDVLLCHHNLFYLPSPYHLYDDLFSVPFSKVLFARIDDAGELHPMCGNILGDRVEIPSEFPLPPDEKKYYHNRILIKSSSVPFCKPGDMILTRPDAPYDIIYNWAGQERTQTKVSADMVCGVVSRAILNKRKKV